MNSTSDPDFWRQALQRHRPEPYPDPEETTMTDQFIDREALEAAAYEQWPKRWENTSAEVYQPNDPLDDPERDAFMAGVDAENAQLLANAETMWGVKLGRSTYEPCDTHLQAIARTEQAHKYLDNPDAVVVSRRVLRTAWTTDEEGK